MTVSVTRSGDSDITVNKASLTFTASNWDAAQTVMVSAAEDDDAAAGTATIAHGVTSSGDYSGETASSVNVTERDNDSASTIVTLSVSPDEVSENSSGQVVTVTGTLNGGTRANETTVSVTVGSGTAISGTDFATVGAMTLTIAANQTSGEATFTLSPVNDTIDESDETVSVSGTTTATGLGITSTQMTIRDDDTRGVTVTPTTLSVGEDESEEYTVVLTSQPTAAVTVSMTKSGDTDVTVAPTSLTFTASNWNTAQTVTVSAAEDNDAAAGTATITHGVTSSGDYSGETASFVSVTERDNDSASTTVTLRVSPDEVSENSGGVTVTVTGTLNGGTRANETTVSVTVGSGTATSGTDFATVGAMTLTIDANQTSGTATFTLSPVNDTIDEDNETVSVRGTTTATSLGITSTQMTITDDDTRDVRVAPTTLEIDEGGSEIYTVVLTSQPTAAVTVSVTKSGDDDITVNKSPLTFTASNWNTAQTVTVNAAEDGDAAAGTATITHGVTSSGDYSGETASSVSVTERDNDSASTTVTLRVSPNEVSENSNGVTVTVTGTLNGGTRANETTVSVSIGSGTATSGTDFATVGAMTLTIDANQTSGEATFTLSPVNDEIDENDETVTVSGTTTAIGLNITSTQVTIEDDDTRGVTVTPPTLSVGEDESEEYTVVLTSQPTAAVTVSVTKSGDTDVTVAPTSLIFTSGNWDEAQTVTVSAAEDNDAAAGTATIAHGVTSSGDYNGETASSVSVTERDNDSVSTTVTLSVSPDEVSENSGGVTVTVTGTLNGGTRANETTVSVSVGSGTATLVTDFATVGAMTLTIDANQTSGTATFTLSPVNDTIDEDNETVSVRGTTTATSLGITSTQMTITDDDTRDVRVAPTTLSVGEGDSEEYTVVLTSQPTEAVTVSVTKSGDTDVTVNKTSLTFTTSNWNTAQTVTVNAAADGDAVHGTATIAHGVTSSGDYNGETASSVSVTERDNDSVSTTVTLSVSPDEVSENSGGVTVTVTGTLNGGTRANETTVSVSVGSGTATLVTDFATVGAIALTIAANQTSGTATFTLSPVNDTIDEDNETVSVRGTTTATSLGITSTQMTITDDDTRDVTVTPTTLSVGEGDSEEYTVVLTSQPTEAVTVSVTKSGDTDVTVNKFSLIFTTSNWNTAQTVTVNAAEDGDAVHGTATIAHGVTSSGDYNGETASSVSVTERDKDSASTTVTLSVSPDEVSESSSGQVVTVTGTLNGGTRGGETTVSVSVGSGTATSGADFAVVGAITLTIGANQTSGEATFTLSPVNDAIDEIDEMVSVSGATSGLNVTSTSVTITDDDTRDVTVTPTTLSVGEGDSEEYTVVLTSQPTEAVTVSVTKSGDTDVTVNKFSLIFTTSNWNTAQTVTVNAAEDGDAVHGTATIAHGVTSSGDYNGETASSVSVTERDKDSASTTVTLSVSPDEVSESSSGQVVTVTGTLNGGTRGGETTVSVSVGSGTATSGADFAVVGAITLTIGANQTSGEATFTLSPVNDAIDEIDEMVSVSGATSGLNVTSTSVTITDDDTRDVTVTPTTLSVGEGDSEEYTVVLTSQPTEAVTVSVTKSGDSDITVNKSPLTFTASNWNTAQTVTVNAAEDGDAVHGTATIAHGVTSSGDYNGETASSVSVTERDKDSASTTVTLSVSPDEVSESSSGQVVTVTGTLNGGTRANETTVSVSIGSGTATSGTDFAAVGAMTLTIAENQTSGEATFTLSPVNDAIDENDETVSVSGTTSVTGLTVEGTEVTITDDDDRDVTVTPPTLSVGEGESEEYTVILTSQPTAAVTVSVTRSGDSDITVNKSPLTFTASNWNTAQTVTVSAAEDTDAAAGTATITHGVTSSGDYSGETASSVSVTERDNDSASTTVTLSVSPDEVSESSSGQVVTVTGTLNGGTRGDATIVSVSVSGGTASSTDFASVDAITVTIGANQSSGTATFTLSPVNDAIDENDETVSVSGTTSVTGLSITSTQVTITDDDTRDVTVTPPTLSVGEGESEEYTVVLTSQPTAAVTVSVTRSGDDDITVNKLSLTFTASNWDAAQTVMVNAAEDDDAVHGTATITHSVSSSGDYSGETASSVSVTERDNDSASTTVTLRVSPDEVSENSSGLVVTVTGTLNGGTRANETTVSVSIGSGTATSGTDFATVDAITVTIAANQSSGTATFTLSPVNDAIDETDETVTVSGTTTAIGLTVEGTEVTITDDDDRGVTVTPPTLSVGEGDSEEYTVVLTSQPTAAVTVSMTKSGDTDVTVNKISLTFTTSNWDAAQTVMVSAAEDGDAAAGTATIAHGVTSSGDYSGETASSVSVTERDNDSASTIVTLSVSPDEVSENSSGQVVTVTGTLNGSTRGDATTVSVTVGSGTATSSTDFATVDAITLTIAANQASGEATFTLSPMNDAIDEDNETVSVSGTTSVTGLSITSTQVTITDDDDRGVTVTPTTLSVGEGESEEYTVVLTSQPTAAVTVSVTKSGDDDITVNKPSLTFTASNWDAAQTVMVSAAEDGDAAAGTATIAHGVTSSGDYSGETASSVSVTERDNDSASTIVTLSVSPDEVSENSSGQVVTVTGTLNGSTRGDATTVSVTVGSGTATSSTDFATVGAITLTISANQASGEATFTLNPVNDAIDEVDETVSVSGTTSGLSVTSTSVTITDDDTPTPLVPMPRMTISPASQTESARNMVFEVRLSKASEKPITAICTTLDGTAEADKDYEEQMGVIRINPGSMTGRVIVRLIDDDVEEGDETLMMVLSELVNAEFEGGGQTATARGTILDDDEPEPEVFVSFDQSHYTVSEGGNAVQIRVHLSSTFDHRMELSLSAVPGNGATKADYSGVPKKVVFETWEDVTTFEVMAIDDDEDDDGETVVLNFDTLPDGIYTGGQSTIEIIDNDDPIVTVSYGKEKYEIPEGNARLLSVRLSEAPERRVEIPLLAVPGNGATEADYSPVPKRIIFLPHQVEKMFEVRAFEDDEDDDGETVALSFGTLPDRVNEGSLSTLCIIDNDDPEVKVSFGERNYEITEGGPAVQVRVHLSADPERRVVIPLWMSSWPNGATEADYSGVPEHLIFESGEQVKTFAVRATDDDEIEDVESVRMRFRSLPDGVTWSSLSTLSIIDNDNPDVTVSFGQESYETVEGGSAVQVTVHLSADPRRLVVIPLLASPGDGATKADYSGIPEQVVFQSGETEKTFDLLATDDNVDDDSETLRLSFGSLPDRVNKGGSALVSLVDNDDPVVAVFFDQSHYTTATEGGSAVMVQVFLSADPERRVAIPLLASPGDGATEADYSGVPEQVVFQSGETKKTFDLIATDDNDDDDDETVKLGFGTLPDRVNNGGSALVSLVDNDDPVVAVSFDQSHYTATEGDAVTVTVSLSADPERRVEIPLLVTPGNGATVEDCSGVPERVIFDGGEMVKTFELLAMDDDMDDDGETLTLSFGRLPNRVNNGGSALVSLVDNDDPVVMVFFDQAHYTATEGGSAVTVTISLSADPERRVEIPLLVTPGNGATVEDCSGVPERVIFESGETVKTFDLLATDDDMDDDGETLTLSFGRLPNRVNNVGSALVSLVDNDDPVVMVSFDQSHYTVTEGGSAVTVTISLSADPERRVVIPLLASPGDGATEADYSGVPEQVVFQSGETKKTFDLIATDDNDDDDDETVKLGFGTLPDRVNNGGSALVSLVDNDDPVVAVSFDQSHYTATEGDAVTVTVSLSADPERRVEIPLLVTPGNGATVEDCSGVPERVIFESGEMVKTFDLLATDDEEDDDDEMVTLSFGRLPNRVNNGGSALVSLVDNDDPVVAVSFDQSHYTATEGDAATVTVSLSADPERRVEIPLLVTPGNGATVEDCSGVPERVIFDGGEMVKTFELLAMDDDMDDDGETLTLSFGRLPNRVNNGGSALVSLVDNDDPVVMVFFDQSHYTVTEGGSAVTVTISLSADPERRVAIPLLVTLGNGATVEDCSGVPERVIFDSGEMVKTFELLAMDDDMDEDDETMALGFGVLPQRVRLGSQATVKIIDNDERNVTVSVAELAIPEGSANTYTVVLHSMPTSSVTLQVSGMENTDVLVEAPQLTFTAGNWYVPQEVEVRARDDDDAVVDRVVTLNHAISGGDYGTVVVAPVSVTIIEDDVPMLSIEDQSASEDAAEMVFTAMLNVQSSEEVRVSYKTLNGTAEAGTDYKATQGILRFAALETHQTFLVPIINDDLDEGDETFMVILSEPVNATLRTDNAQALGTIVDEDAVPRAMELLLSSVGRLVATETVEIISRRFESQRLGIRPSLMLGGRILSLDDRMGGHALLGLARNLAGVIGVDLWMPSYYGSGGGMGVSQEPMRPLSMSTRQPSWIAHAGNSMDSPVRFRRVTLWDVLSRSAFELPLNHKEQGGQWTLWGQGAASRISGQPSAVRTIDLESLSGYLGIDYRFHKDALVGLTLTHILGDMDYGGRDDDSLVPFDFNLTSLMPYFYYQVRPKLGLWGILGIGRGRASMTKTEESLETPMMLFMGASGMRQDLATYRSIDLAVKADAFFVSTGSEAQLNLSKLRENVERVRLLLEGRNTRQMGTASQLTQSLEVGTRWDVGRIARGAGIDLGGGLEYAHTELGLGVAARGRYLLIHGRSGYEEWGASLMLRTDPGWGKRGLVLTMAPVWGVPSQGAEAMWRDTQSLISDPVRASQQRPGIRPDRMEVDFGYRFVRHATGALIMPYSGFSFGGRGWQSYRLGGRVAVDQRMDFNLEIEHGSQAQSSIRLRTYMYW